jgi:tetratricopeptide (TPR) repeat protein
MINIYDKILNILYKALILILPLFFLPWTISHFGADNFNKQNLLWLVVPVLLFIFLFKNYREGKLHFKRTPLDIPIIFFLFVLCVSTLFSTEKFSSLFGGYGNINLPLLGFTIFIIFYYFTINYLNGEKSILKIINLLIISYILLVFTSLYLISGLVGSQYISIIFKLIVGTIEEFSIYLIILDIIVFAFLIHNNFQSLFDEKWMRVILQITFLLSLLILSYINFLYAWLGLITGILLVFLFIAAPDIKKFLKNLNKAKIFWSILLIILPLYFVFGFFVSGGNNISASLSSRYQLDYKNTSLVALESIKKNPLLGFGPDTFNYAFSLLRDRNLNNTENWDLRFNQGASFLEELIIATGILGCLAYLSIIASFIYCFYLFIKIRNHLESDEYLMLLALGVALLIIFFEQILFNVNYNMLFLEWLLFGLFMVGFRSRLNERNTLFQTIDFNFMKRFDWAQSTTLILVVLSTFWVILLTFNIRFVLAEYYYRTGKDSEEKLILTTELNPFRYNYMINIAKYYLQKGLTESTKANGSEVLENVKNDFQKSVDWAEQATKTSSQAVAAQETLGMVYRQIGRYSTDGLSLSIKAFSEARKLEPTNPIILVELGKVNMEANKFTEADSLFVEAIKMKPDYNDAKYNQAVLFSEQGKNNEALSIFNGLDNGFNNSEIYYERGKVYFNLKKYSQAIDDFKKVLEFYPLHANAMYSLGLSYISSGDKEEGLYYLKKVLKLNPNNEELKKKINNIDKE